SFFFSSRRRHTRFSRDWSSDVCSSDLNDPMWDIAIQLKTLAPELPIINDPSHICGNADLIPYISQKALDLDMQGLMIESHIDPSVAWTDAKQQVTPAALSEMISNFTLRKVESNNPVFDDKLSELRENIDKLDNQIIQKVAERMKVVEKIGEFNRDNNVTIV